MRSSTGTLPQETKNFRRGRNVATIDSMAKPLELKSIVTTMPGLTRAKAAAFVEAASVCLWERSHRDKTVLHVQGQFEVQYDMGWEHPTEQTRRTYADPQEATEEGATAVAIAVVVDSTEYVVVERAMKSGGFDYWLGYEPAVLAARLEISGIRDGTASSIKARMKQKLEQMSPSDDSGFPGYAVVVEFGRPEARVEKK